MIIVACEVSIWQVLMGCFGSCSRRRRFLAHKQRPDRLVARAANRDRMKHIDVAIGIVCKGGQVLICRRKQDGHLAGFWEFPGGKVEPGESPAQCVARELREELDIEVNVATALPTIEHDYPDRQVRLHPFLCDHRNGIPKPIGCDETIWVNPPALREYKFPNANDGLIEDLIKQMDRE